MAVKKTAKKVTKKVVKFDKHAHATCDHKLKFCKHCDTAYCSKCSMEWKKQFWTSTTSGTNQYLCGTQGTTARGGLDLMTNTASAVVGTTSASTEAVINHSKHK